MSSRSGVAEGFSPTVDIDAPRRAWLAALAVAVVLPIVANILVDQASGMNYGWDVRVNCAAVDAYDAGLDPYFVKNLKGTQFSYPYLPVTLDAFRPLCAGGILVNHHRPIYLLLALLCGLLLPGLGTKRSGPSELALRMSCTFGVFVGLEWLLASGNFAMFSGLLTALALMLLVGGAPGTGDRFARSVAGAVVLGLLSSFKLVFCPVLAALYFLPLPRARKLALVAVAGLSFTLPILVSMVFYHDLFASWLHAVSGEIPAQHSIYQYGTNQSLLVLASALADRVGFSGSRIVTAALYALGMIALVVGPFAWSIGPVIGWRGPEGPASFLRRFDAWLIAHPPQAMRITVLAMYGLYLCSPRLKEYAFFELALYAAVLFVDLRTSALVAALVCSVAVLSAASLSGSTMVEDYGQAAAAFACFWLMLADLRARGSADAAEATTPARPTRS